MATTPMHAYPKHVRLRLSRDYRRTLDGGVKTVCPLVVLFLRPRVKGEPGESPDADGVRLGVIASRKVGNAVVRNRIKRRLREAYRHLRPELQAVRTLSGADLVVIARAGAATADGAQLADALRHCVKRLRRQLEPAQPESTST